MNIKIPAFVTPPSIYRGCSTRKRFWEEIFTLVKMINCFPCNVRKCREIKYGKKYITLGISLKLGILDKMKITSSEPKDYLGRSGKGLIAYLGINNIVRSKKKRQVMSLLMSV